MSTKDEDFSQMGKWDGHPRRKNDIYLEVIEKKIDRIDDFLRHQFGDTDLAGNKIEGTINKEIRLILENIVNHEHRLAKLETRNTFIDGSVKLASLIFAACIAIGTLVAEYFRRKG